MTSIEFTTDPAGIAIEFGDYLTSVAGESATLADLNDPRRRVAALDWQVSPALISGASESDFEKTFTLTIGSIQLGLTDLFFEVYIEGVRVRGRQPWKHTLELDIPVSALNAAGIADALPAGQDYVDIHLYFHRTAVSVPIVATSSRRVAIEQDLSELRDKTIDIEVADTVQWQAPPANDAALTALPIDEEVGGAIFDRDREIDPDTDFAGAVWSPAAAIGEDDSIVVVRVRRGQALHDFAVRNHDGYYIKLNARDRIARDDTYEYFAADDRTAFYGDVALFETVSVHHTTFHGRLGEEPLAQIAKDATLFNTIAPVPASSANRDLPRTLHLVFGERRRAGVVTGVVLATQGQALALAADTPVRNIAGESGALKFSLAPDLVQTIANNLPADADSIQLDLELTFDDASTERHRIPFLVNDPAFPGKFDPNTVDGITDGDVTQIDNARAAGFQGLSVWHGTKAQFDALAAKDASTIYFYPPA